MEGGIQVEVEVGSGRGRGRGRGREIMSRDGISGQKNTLRIHLSAVVAAVALATLDPIPTAVSMPEVAIEDSNQP